MSYCLIPYAIDLPTLRAAIGSKDAALIRSIRETDSSKFDKINSKFTLGQALNDLVMGEPLSEEAPHQYGYALEKLCKRFGNLLKCDVWGGVRWAALKDAGLLALFGSGPPVTLPKIPDFPMVAFLDRKVISALAKKLDSEGFANPNRQLQELLNEFGDWIHIANNSGQDMVLFYY